jgi:hypothetical protein
MAGRKIELFMNVRPRPNRAFYLKPEGLAANGLAYLPAFNTYVRGKYEKTGKKLLNQVTGDFADQGENRLQILPPTRERVMEYVAEMKRRVPIEKARLEELLEEDLETVRDEYVPADERRVYRDRIRSLKRKIESIDQLVPTLPQAFRFFQREYQLKLAEAVPDDFKKHMGAVMQQQDLMVQSEKLIKELEAEEAGAAPAPPSDEAVPIG